MPHILDAVDITCWTQYALMASRLHTSLRLDSEPNLF